MVLLHQREHLRFEIWVFSLHFFEQKNFVNRFINNIQTSQRLNVHYESTNIFYEETLDFIAESFPIFGDVSFENNSSSNSYFFFYLGVYNKQKKIGKEVFIIAVFD